MKKIRFNTGWILNPADPYEIFMNPQGVKKQHEVILPYDAMLLEKRTADVPHGRDCGFYPDGQCTYVKKFTVPETWAYKTIVLEFEGIYSNSMIYVNDDYAGSCPNGYTCFKVNLDRFLKYGQENEIKVMAKKAHDSRWYSGMGIYRNVNLLIGNPCHIIPDGHRIYTEAVNGKDAEIVVNTQLFNFNHSNITVRIKTEIIDETGNIVAEDEQPLTLFANDKQELIQRIHIENVNLWDTETPYLYTAVTTAISGEEEIDKESDPFGIRTLALDPVHGLRINGKELKLRGACVHHDNGILGAADIDRAEERRVQKLKEAGFNAVRSAHNPISKAFLAACDRYGLVVMDELTDMWTQRKGEWDYSTDFPNHWPELVDSIVAKDFNHPSVIMYSIGNEIREVGGVHGARIGRELAYRLKKLDPARFTTNAVNLLMASQGRIDMQQMAAELPEMIAFSTMDTMEPEKEKTDSAGSDMSGMTSKDINDIMRNLGPFMAKMVNTEAVGKITEETFSVVDIAGYNYAASRYEKDHERYPGRVIVGSETFPQEIAGNWEKVKKFSYVIGDFTWTGWDYLGEAGIGASTYKEDNSGLNMQYPWYIAWCGDFDITGERRPVSYYREIVFGLRKNPYIAVRYPEVTGKTRNGGSWDFVDGFSSWTWPGNEGKELEIEVYGVGDYAELFLNGKKIGRAELSEYRTVIKAAYYPGELTAVCYKAEKETGRYSIQTAGSSVKLKAEADRYKIKGDDSDLAYIEISLVDENGIINPYVDREVTVSVEGSGYLAGLGSADPRSEENFLTGKFKTFHGKLLGIIRPLAPGEILVNIKAEQVEDVNIKICVTD